MKKRILALLVCFALFGVLATTAAGENTVDTYSALTENNWYGTTTDDQRIDMAWELLHIFRYAGYPVGSIAANDFAQAMNDYYDWDKSLSVWNVALTVLGEELEAMGQSRFFPQYYIEGYKNLFENDWYGTTTDDERIAMAGDVLNLIRAYGTPVGLIQNHELAQAMNDYYDQDKSLSVWEVALIALEPMILDEDDLWMPYHYAAEDAAWYQDLFEPNWYGTNTDSGRIDMAWELLSILRQCGYAVGHICPNDFAQAMNNYFDTDKTLSIWEVALIAL